MLSASQKELINNLYDLFYETYKNINWHQTGLYLKNLGYYLNAKNYKEFFYWLKVDANFKPKYFADYSYIASKLFNAIKHNLKVNPR